MSAAAGAAAEPAPSGRREAGKQANRAAILAAGREVFAELGYGAATVRDIVRRTPLATGTFYNYFPDKEAVFRELLEQSAGEARARVRAARLAADSPDGFVREGYRAYFGFLAGDPQLFDLVRRNAGTIRTHFSEPAFGLGVAELEEDLAGAIAAGVLPDVGVRWWAAAMAGIAFEVGVRMVEDEPPDVEGATRFAAELCMGGIERLRA